MDYVLPADLLVLADQGNRPLDQDGGRAPRLHVFLMHLPENLALREMGTLRSLRKVAGGPMAPPPPLLTSYKGGVCG